MSRSGSKRFCRLPYCGKVYNITEQQWRTIELLSPNWIFIKGNIIHFSTRLGLQKRGWAEFRRVAGFLQVRLSAAGREIRDEVYRRMAVRHARELGEKI